MKSYYSFLFILLLAKTGFCLPADSISEKLGGHIREMKVYTITPKHDENGRPQLGKPADSILTLIYSYDKSQRLIESIIGDAEGNIMGRKSFKYNDKGWKSEEADYSGEGHMRDKETFKYDEKGNMTEHAKYENGKEMESKVVFKYNKAGKKISEITYKEEEGMIGKKIFEYNPHGNLIGTKDFDKRDSLVTGYDYLYDGHDNKIQEIRYTPKGEEWKYVYTYTPFNKKEKEVHLSPYKTSNSTTVWHYNDDHNMIEEIIYDYKDKVIQKSSYKYVKGKLVNAEANNSTTEYEYDSSGNKVNEKIKVMSGQNNSESRLISEQTFDKKGTPFYGRIIVRPETFLSLKFFIITNQEKLPNIQSSIKTKPSLSKPNIYMMAKAMRLK